MFIFYDLIFLLVCVFYFPIYLCKRKFHRGFWARLGFLPEGVGLDRPIWLHAVSVGEAITIRSLL
jgi:3-deoxy-D-manno-octulosonic-acid transferase